MLSVSLQEDLKIESYKKNFIKIPFFANFSKEIIHHLCYRVKYFLTKKFIFYKFF